LVDRHLVLEIWSTDISYTEICPKDNWLTDILPIDIWQIDASLKEIFLTDIWLTNIWPTDIWLKGTWNAGIKPASKNVTEDKKTQFWLTAFALSFRRLRFLVAVFYYSLSTKCLSAEWFSTKRRSTDSNLKKIGKFLSRLCCKEIWSLRFGLPTTWFQTSNKLFLACYL
jgi:hypothetical protein